MVDHLPRNTAYGEAIALDESLVDPDTAPTGTARPSMREWSPEVELLAAIFDRLSSLIQVQADKDLKLKPWPAPVTAAEILKQYRRQQNRSRLETLIADAKRRGAEN